MIWLGISVMLYAFNNLLWKTALERMSPTAVMALRAAITSLGGWLLVFLLYPEDIQTLDRVSLPLLFPALSGAFGLACMLSGLRYGNLGQLGIYGLAGILFTVSYLLWFEKVPILHYAEGALLIFSGYVWYLLRYERSGAAVAQGLRPHLYFAGMTFFFGLSGILHWHNLRADISPFLSMVSQESIVLLLAFILLFAKGWKFGIVNISEAVPHLGRIALMAVVISLAIFTGFLGLSATDPLVSTLTALSVSLLTIWIDRLYFRKSIEWALWAIMALLSTGYVVLAWQLNEL